MKRPVRAGADMRLLRAVVFTAVCVVLSAAGHTLASGHTVPLWTLLAGWLAVLAVVAPLAGRERSLPGIAAGLAVGQITLHLLFSVGERCAWSAATGMTGMGAATDTGTGTGTGGGVVAVAERLLCGGHTAGLTRQVAERIVRQAGVDPAGAATSMRHSAGGATDSYSLSMLLGHLIAALVAGWLLRRGDAALWRLVELSDGVGAGAMRRAVALVRVLVTGAIGGARAALTPPVRFAYEPRPPRTTLLRHSMARRGPPVLALAA